MVDQEIYEDDALPSGLRWQIISFMRMQWPAIFSGPDRLSTAVYPGGHTSHCVLSEQEVLISYAAVLWQRLVHAGETYKMYGLGTVFTYPQFRHEGYGRQVVTVATAYIRQSDADVAALFCDDHLVPFYTQSGWEVAEGATLVGLGDTPRLHDERRMMLYVSPKGQAARAHWQHDAVYVREIW